jgi:hypothetical protein
MKIIYLGAYQAVHPNHNMIYQDINGKRDISGDMLDVDLTPYDVIIATPPCNYWSKARGSKKPSQYSLDTKHLLPSIIKKLIELDKPFIVENVRNKPAFMKEGLYDLPCFIYHHGRHTYWTNMMFNPKTVDQHFDFKYGGVKLVQNTQGGSNVHNVIEYWLKVVKSYAEI